MMPMKTVKVVSKKYDGSLREEYDAYLLSKTPEAITLLSLPGAKSYDHRKQRWSVATDGLIEIFPKAEWFNVWHICEQHSGLNLTYVNIALPATYREDRLEWVDMDLDYRHHLDGTIEALDEDEFLQNAERWNYPPSVIEQCRAASQKVETGLAQGRFPFNHSEQLELYCKLVGVSGVE